MSVMDQCRQLAHQLKRLRSEAWVAGDQLEEAARYIEQLEAENVRLRAELARALSGEEES